MIVLIAGVSGGLGGVIGDTLTQEGMKVYGTMRKPEGHESEYSFDLLPMEITSEQSVQECVDEVVKREGRIDVVINCVNQLLMGTTEEQTVEEVAGLMDINVLGSLRLNKAVLPVMLKQGSGTIVTMSSGAGILAIPFASAYAASKFAVEAMCESLHYELMNENIDIVIMQPVAMRMDRPATGAHLDLFKNVTSESKTHQMIRRMDADTQGSKLPPEAVAKKIHDVITSRKKPLRVPMDKSKAFSFLKRIAPQFVLDRALSTVADKY